jgi:hypothetical protein
MTEAEWLACTDPLKMLPFLRESGKASDRKLRLFACGCCRSLCHLLTDERSQRAVEVAERYADGAATGEDLAAALEAAAKAPPWYAAARATAWVANGAAWDAAWNAYAATKNTARAAAAATLNTATAAAWDATSDAALVALLRDHFGNPFRPVSVDPAWLSWRGGTVPRLAQAAYEHRHLPEGHLDPARLAVLADALEEAGCQDPDILGHLRGPGPHVRGCWAVDILTGRE